MAEGDMLPIIVFAILIGLSIALAGKPGERIGQFFSDFNVVVMRLVGFVMLMAPLWRLCPDRQPGCNHRMEPHSKG